MLQRKRDEWRLYPHKVKGVRHDNEFEQWALPNKKWWEITAENHDHLKVDEFEEIKVTDDMEKRYEEIKHMPEDFKDIYIEYVLNGDVSEDVELPTNHPFQVIRLRHSDKSQEQDITDTELDNMRQDQAITDLELQLLSKE